MQSKNSIQLPGFIHIFNAKGTAENSPPSTKKSESRPKKRYRGANPKSHRCSHEDCEKTFSRAEHLQRHQLNHDPKEIFYCGTLGCTLSFVRKDLCDRHRRRHGQQSADQQASSAVEGKQETLPKDTNQDLDANDSSSSSESERSYSVTPIIPFCSVNRRAPVLNSDREKIPSMEEYHKTPFRNLRDRFYRSSEISMSNEELQKIVADAEETLSQTSSNNNFSFSSLTRFQSNVSNVELLTCGNQPTLGALETRPYGPLGEYWLPPLEHHPVPSSSFHSSHQGQVYTSSPNSIPPYHDGFEICPPSRSRQVANTSAYETSAPTLEQGSADNFFSSFGPEDQSLGISPSASTGEFASWLFDQNEGVRNGMSNGGDSLTNVYQPNVFGQIYSDHITTGEIDMAFGNTISQKLGSNQSYEPLSSTNSSLMSPWKRQNLLDIMQQSFTGSSRSGIYDGQIKQQIFDANLDDEDHVLSLISLQRFIDSYWINFHAQFPILHRPSFMLDNVHDFLLLAVVVVGASLLDRQRHGSKYTAKASQLSIFIAWNLRGQISNDPDSCPPAKLWVLQSLAILEVYEKTNATRALHERAHVHFPAMLTLMRRGTTLVGESQSLTSQVGDQSTNGRQGEWRGTEPPTLRETWWSQWIAQEATRRAAFGAFLLDATHAVMFGHSATMVIHEIQLPLPCDDILWSASTPSEAERLEFSLYTNGIKPITFLNGLKRTLSCRRVRTNPFGRTVLMAGLLSISWHMNQRELYGKSLDNENLGVPKGWKAQIVRALEWWKKESDESLAYMRRSGIDVHNAGFTQEHLQTSEYLASAMYHLGHIGLQVHRPDLCAFAGAKVLLGRVIAGSDLGRVLARMKTWVTSQAAQHAVFYSLRFICSVLFCEREINSRCYPIQGQDQAQSSEVLEDRSIYAYNASTEVLLLRPWVLYFSTLVVWAYGFLLDGPCEPFPDHLKYPLARVTRSNDLPTNMPSPQHEPLREREQDAKAFLQSMSRCKTPADLDNVSTGRNKVIGLISVVSKVLEDSRWELLDEARDRLRGAAESLKRKTSI